MHVINLIVKICYCHYFHFIITQITYFFYLFPLCWHNANTVRCWDMHASCPYVIWNEIISSILKVLWVKITTLQHTVFFFTQPSLTMYHLLECSVTFPVCHWDWNYHQNLGKPIWILHVADLCQDRFSWVMSRYFLPFSVDFHVGWFLSWVPQHYKLCSYRKGKENRSWQK